MSKVRIDIQALRAIAVMLVVLEHAELGPLYQGFLGVDIFFVISGYLITSIINQALINNTFSFKVFYFKRVKRLLPAAYTTILLTSIASIWFLNALEMSALFSQVLGALTFTINFVLLNQTGYFDISAAFKPLLHMWSLAVEEQFYLLFPALLFFVPRRFWLCTIISLGLLSFVGCVSLGATNPTAAFYLLPTRAWELLIGALGALMAYRWENTKIIKILFWPALLALLLLPIFSINESLGLPHPSIDAFIICVATLIIILAKNHYAATGVLSKGLAKLGNISYSLYLVHWPIIVFMNSAYTTQIPLSSRIIALSLSILLAVILNRFVETPFRKIQKYSLRFGISTVLASILLICVQLFSTSYAKTDLDFSYIRRPNYGLDRVCDNYLFKPRPECQSADTPDTLIWGDSYAMHTIPGIVAYPNTNQGIVQATYSACPPFLGTAPYNKNRTDAIRVSQLCMQFNDNVRQYIEQTPHIKQVILAASFWQYTQNNNQMLSRTQTGKAVIGSTSLEQAQADLGRTIQALQNAGKEVIVISPPPAVGEENLTCMERLLSEKFVFGSNPRCEVDYGMYTRANAGVIALTNNIEQTFKIRVIRLSQAVCNEQVCQSILDGVPLYRDSAHLSYSGSEKIFEQLSNSHQLW